MADFKQVTLPKFRLEPAITAIRTLLNLAVPMKVSYAAIRTRKELEPHLMKLQALQRDLALPFVVKDSNGRPVPNEHGDVQWIEGGQAAYMEAWSNLLQEEVTVPVFTVDFKTAFPNENDTSVRGAIVADLDFMFRGLYEDEEVEEEKPKPKRRRKKNA